jgi:hypothetical protein
MSVWSRGQRHGHGQPGTARRAQGVPLSAGVRHAASTSAPASLGEQKLSAYMSSLHKAEPNPRLRRRFADVVYLPRRPHMRRPTLPTMVEDMEHFNARSRAKEVRQCVRGEGELVVDGEVQREGAQDGEASEAVEYGGGGGAKDVKVDSECV